MSTTCQMCRWYEEEMRRRGERYERRLRLMAEQHQIQIRHMMEKIAGLKTKVVDKC